MKWTVFCLLVLAVASARADLALMRRRLFFDLEMLQLTAETDKGNIILSPASVRSTLAMVWEGAEGESAEQIRNALRLPVSPERQHKELKDFYESLRSHIHGSSLKMANRVFLSDKYEPNPKYVESLRNYDATVQKVNMSVPQEVAEEVNNWVNSTTNGLVPQLVDSANLSPDTIMMLANAIYFRGTWQHAFDPDETRVGCFSSERTQCRHVHMMETMGVFRNAHVSDLDALVLELPYEDKYSSMILVLPERRDGMDQVVRDLAYSSILDVIDAMRASEIKVTIPKFSLDYSTDLAFNLRHKLKLPDVFSNKANLSSMVLGDVQPVISNVFHKARIEVDEHGATAGAATGALVVPLMGGSQPHFLADHPFLIFIRDKSTGAFLFVGRVSEPNEVQPGQPIKPDVSNNEAYPAPSGVSQPQAHRPTTASSPSRPTTRPPTTGRPSSSSPLDMRAGAGGHRRVTPKADSSISYPPEKRTS